MGLHGFFGNKFFGTKCTYIIIVCSCGTSVFVTLSMINGVKGL